MCPLTTMDFYLLLSQTLEQMHITMHQEKKTSLFSFSSPDLMGLINLVCIYALQLYHALKQCFFS